MSSTNDYLLRNQQDEPTSSSSTIRPSSEGNQSSYFTASNEGPTLVAVETVIDTGEEDRSVEEKGEEIKVKEERKGEQAVQEEDEDYIQVDI